MSVIFEINRDFPFQVALPFDEVAMEVLAWLEGRSFEWDMYVDLPAGMVRYCFQTSADATAFTRSLCMRRKGELSAAGIDQGWPHQVVLPAPLCERHGYNEIHEFCRDLTLCSRGHALFHDGQWIHVYCFKEAVDAQKFVERFDGEKFDSVERGRGANWARWKKGCERHHLGNRVNVACSARPRSACPSAARRRNSSLITRARGL
jgi:hypothetical protein